MQADSRALATRRPALRVEQPDFELWAIRAVNTDGSVQIARPNWTEDQYLDRVPVKGVTKFHPGDVALVQFQDGKRNRPQVLSLSSKLSKFATSTPVQINVDLGGWPTSFGPPTLNHYSFLNQSPLSEIRYQFFLEVGPSIGGYAILGLVAYDAPNGASALAVYYRKDAGFDRLENVLSTFGFDGQLKWSVVVGESYPVPGLGTQDWSPGAAQSWLAYDATAKVFWVVGHGSAVARKQLTVIRNDGSVITNHSAVALLSQSTAAGGSFIKGWHSRRPPTEREQDNPNLLGFVLEESRIRSWTLDPQSFLPGIQLATSEVEIRGGAICPEGRWPVTASGLMLFWLSGSRPNVAGKVNAILEIYQSGGGADDMCAFANSATADDSKTQEHKACLVGINVNTGKLIWRRDWAYSAVHQLDSNAYNGWLATFPSPAPGDIGLSYFNFRGLVDSSYANTYSYASLASAMSLSLHPITVSDLPGCAISNPSAPPEEHIPVYSPGSEIIFPWFGPGWGSGAGAQFQLSRCGEWLGPVYDWFQPGHPVLLPLPQMPGFGENGPSLTWPVNQHTARMDPVGGTLCCDANGNAWHCHMVQSHPILDDFKLQLQYGGHTETFIPPTLPTQCGQWSNRQLQWIGYAVGLPSHHPILRLCCTGPTGQPIHDVDISQYFTPPVIGGGPSSIPRGAVANVWQIIPVPSSNVVLVVRDWFAQFSDDDGLENLPYPVIEVRDYASPSTVVQRIPLTDDLTIYNAETDPEAPPIIQRTIDQYANPATLKSGKGSVSENGAWIQWSHLCRDREAATDICNRVQLRFTNGSQVPVIDRWTGLGTAIPDSRNKVDSMVVAGDRVSWISGDATSTGYFVTITS